MTPIRTEHSNITFTKEGCDDLPATRCTNQYGEDEVEICCELSDEELAEVVKNRKIYLYIMGRNVPPLYMTAQSEIVC